MTEDVPFWKRKTLEQMDAQEWESLCDGCGRCCLHKLEYEDTGALDYTNVACQMLDGNTCGCADYLNRQRHVPDCVTLTPDEVRGARWLPPSCGYRLVNEGKDLPDWHHLISGDRDAVHRVGASVRGRVISERVAGALEQHIVAWPGKPPGWRARR